MWIARGLVCGQFDKMSITIPIWSGSFKLMVSMLVGFEPKVFWSSWADLPPLACGFANFKSDQMFVLKSRPIFAKVCRKVAKFLPFGQKWSAHLVTLWHLQIFSWSLLRSADFTQSVLRIRLKSSLMVTNCPIWCASGQNWDHNLIRFKTT